MFCWDCGWPGGQVWAQTITVKGQITAEESGDPLVGASVVLKKGGAGVFSDEKGEFRLQAPANSVIVVSFFGFEKMEIPLEGRTSLEIVMKSAAYGLDEVVVIGYGTTKKSDLTGSVASVKAEDIRAVPVGVGRPGIAGEGQRGYLCSKIQGNPVPLLPSGFGAPARSVPAMNPSM